jgi:Domain of unknown function (DUF4145)
MIRRNLLGLETRRGYCTCELLEGDITQLKGPVDLLLVSSFAGSYSPTPGTVFGALRASWGIDTRRLAADPEFDLRQALSVWVTHPLEVGPFTRLMCVELKGSPKPYASVIQNAFAAISLLESTGHPVRSIAMPALGAGLQQVPLSATVKTLLEETRKLTQRSDSLERIQFVELASERAIELSDSLDAYLGRHRVLLPKTQILATVRQDIAEQLAACRSAFGANQTELHSEWVRLIGQPEIRAIELGILARRLAEFIAVNLGAPPSQQLHERIRTLEKNEVVAPWVCGYLQLLRHFGNEAAHEQPPTKRHPPFVQEDDLPLALFCVNRLLTVWPAAKANSGHLTTA